MIWIVHPVESVCSYVNCSIMPKIPHHPSAFLFSEKFINYATRSVRKRCKFVLFFFLRECESSSGLIHLHPFKHLHLPAYTHIHTPLEDVNKPRGQRGEGDSRNRVVMLWVTPPVSPRHAAPSYLMGTPDCLMFVTAVQRTPLPADLI